MGCKDHQVEDKIQFLDGRFEKFISLPKTRWQKMTEPENLILAAILAVLAAGLIWLL